MSPLTQFFASLAEQLNRGATRAALGLLSFRSDPLREHLREVFQSAPGTGDSFLADPVFEASFGWRLAADTLGGLAGKLLHPDVVKALDNRPRCLPMSTPFRPTTALSAPVRGLEDAHSASQPRSVLVSQRHWLWQNRSVFSSPFCTTSPLNWTRGQGG